MDFINRLSILLDTLNVIRMAKDAILRIKSERKKRRDGSIRVKKLKINFTTIEGKRRERNIINHEATSSTTRCKCFSDTWLVGGGIKSREDKPEAVG